MLARVLLIAALALPLSLFAQEAKKEPAHNVYKLDYVIAELEGGKRVEAREYSMLVEENPVMPPTKWGRLRVGNRIPVAGSPTAFNYTDVGVNIDAFARQVTGSSALGLNTKVEVSSVVLGVGQGEKLPTAPGQPTFRNFRTESDVVVPLGKPTVLFALDELNSKRSFQVQVTATLVLARRATE